MTELEFMALCGEHLIEPSIALENEALKEALLWRDDELVEAILKEDFWMTKFKQNKILKVIVTYFDKNTVQLDRHETALKSQLVAQGLMANDTDLQNLITEVTLWK